MLNNTTHSNKKVEAASLIGLPAPRIKARDVKTYVPPGNY
jgi:hypothetical protein